VELRGNVDTRLRKLAGGEVSAAVLAEAGLERLGRVDAIAQRFEVSQMIPAPGQGALAVEAVKGSDVATLVAAIDDRDSRMLIETERLLLAETGAGCRSALGAYATWVDGAIMLQSYVFDQAGGRRSVAFGANSEAVVAGARKDLGL
jgi:hydroxymethylbilane synthase